jgi:O-antigen/teichoic acid export membrane protein
MPNQEQESGEPSAADAARGDLGRKASLSGRIIATRAVLSQLLGLIFGVFLARALGPEPFGQVAVATAIVALLNLPGDLGLHAALIQARTCRTEDVSCAFTLSSLASATIFALVALVGGPVHDLIWEGAFDQRLLLLVAASTLVSQPFRVLAAGAFERNLSFAGIQAAELLETALYYVTALVCANLGLGALSIAVGMAARTIVQVVALLIMAPSMVRPRLDREAAIALLKVGGPLRQTVVVNMVTSLAPQVIIGRLCGVADLGLFLWAHGNVHRPQFLLEAVARVTHPLFARANELDPRLLSDFLWRATYVCGIVAALWSTMLIGAGPETVVVLYGPAWMPAVSTLWLLVPSIYLITFQVLFDNALISSGWSIAVRNVHLVRGALLWCLGGLGAAHYGRNGFAVAHCAALAIAVVAGAVVLRRALGATLDLRATARPVLCAVVSTGACRLLAPTLSAHLSPVPVMLMLLVVSVVGFCAPLLAIDGTRPISVVRELFARGRPGRGG